MEIKSYAKINLSLKIEKKMQDGYHALDMVMQEVDLFDVIHIEKSDKLTVEFSDFRVPYENTVRTAAEMFLCPGEGAKIYVEKNIPTKSGLGGSSSNAASVLKALNSIYRNRYTTDWLMRAGIKIGADVPFFFDGGCMRAKGKGEILTPVENNLDCYYLLAKPHEGVSTAEAYTLFDEIEKPQGVNIDKVVKALNLGDLEMLQENAGNSLEHAAGIISHDFRELLIDMRHMTIPAVFMSGSGSTCVGVFKHLNQAQTVREGLSMITNLELNTIVRNHNR